MQTNFVCDYAKTSRSSCKVCKKTLPEGKMRVGKNSPSPFHDGYILKWYHPACFFKKELKNVKSLSDIRGYDQMKPDDIKTLASFFGESGAAAVIAATPSGGQDTGGAKSNEFWKLKEDLDKELAPKDLKLMLEANGIPATGSKPTLITKVAEGMYYGVSTCPVCSGKEMIFTEGRYKCISDTAWGRCGFEGNGGVQVTKWVKDQNSLQFDFIKKFNVDVLHDRPITLVAGKSSKPAITEYNRDSKNPLKNMSFAACGWLEKSVEEIKNLVAQNGGTFVTSLHPDVDYVISTYGDLVRATNPILTQAKTFKLAIVTELLLYRLLDEFGFDQRPYLLEGQLPPIAMAKLAGTLGPAASAASPTKESTAEAPAAAAAPKKPAPPKVKRGQVDPDAQLPTGVIYKEVVAIPAAVPTEEIDEYSEVKQPEPKVTLYDVMLNQTDIVSGANKYYRLQLIDVDGTGKKFSVFTKWGRVGTDVGAFLKTSPSSLATAMATWDEKYTDKTGNKWAERDNFVKKAGKYFPIEIVDEEENKSDGASKDGDDDSALIPSYLDPRVQDIVNVIFDTNMMKQNMLDLKIDVNKMPLGKLSKATIDNGYNVLRQIETVLQKNDENKTFQLINLSNQFYTIIPHDFGKEKAEVIDSTDLLRLKMAQLEALLDISIASNLMKEVPLTKTHPTDQNYGKLGVDLKPLNKFSRDWKTIIKYVENGHNPQSLQSKLVVLDAFKVERPEEEKRFQKFKEERPRKLLWHGSRLCNFVGILNQGLRIAPESAPKTGYMFGKGIYLADMVAKSAAFCHPNPKDRVGLLILCDAALGASYELKKPEYVEKLPEGKLSTKAVAKLTPDPAKDETLEEKVIVPVGPPVPTNIADVFLEQPEYVVYDAAQVRMKYLVKVKFDNA